jgi:hypothetical protein
VGAAATVVVVVVAVVGTEFAEPRPRSAEGEETCVSSGIKGFATALEAVPTKIRLVPLTSIDRPLSGPHDSYPSVPGPCSVRFDFGGSFSCSAFGFDVGGFDTLRNSCQMYSDNRDWVKSAINTIATGMAMLSIMAARSIVVESVSRRTVCTETSLLEYLTRSDVRLRAAQSGGFCP